MGVRCRCQREARDLRERIHQGSKRAVVGPEVMAPFRHAMRFVYREKADVRLVKQGMKVLPAGALGRDIEQIQLTGAKPFDRPGVIGIGTGQCRGANAVRHRRAQLIVHQRDQRRDDHARPFEHDRRQLVRQRLARAGRHDRQRRLAGQHTINHVLLRTAKRRESESLVQRVELGCVRNDRSVGHGRFDYNDERAWGDRRVGSVHRPGFRCISLAAIDWVGRVVLIHENGQEARIASHELPYKLAPTVSFEAKD